MNVRLVMQSVTYVNELDTFREYAENGDIVNGHVKR